MMSWKLRATVIVIAIVVVSVYLGHAIVVWQMNNALDSAAPTDILLFGIGLGAGELCLRIIGHLREADRRKRGSL